MLQERITIKIISQTSEYIYSGGNSYVDAGEHVTPVAVGYKDYNGDLTESTTPATKGGWGSCCC